MRIDEIIARVDSLEPNQYDTEQKMAWLAQLDGKIFEEIILTHDRMPERLIDVSKFDTDTGRLVLDIYNSTSQELIAGPPYGEDMYCYYVQAMISLHNRETAKYNQMMIMYSGAYQEYANWYNRTHKPLPTRGGNRFKF